MSWQSISFWIFVHAKAFFAGIGITGGGVGFIKLMKHWPAPKKKNRKLGAIFDTAQDIISNNERIGQRSDSDSAFVSIKKESGTETESSSSVTANAALKETQT